MRLAAIIGWQYPQIVEHHAERFGNERRPAQHPFETDERSRAAIGADEPPARPELVHEDHATADGGEEGPDDRRY